jgi:hypothetical protein
MEKFRQWYLRNYIKITWFVIGLLTTSGIEALSDGRYISAVFYFALAYINYFFERANR